MRRVHVEVLQGLGGSWEAATRLAERPGLAWLDADGAGERGRYAFVGSDPVQVRRRRLGDTDDSGIWAGVGRVAADDESAQAGTGRGEGPPAHRVPAWAGYVAYDAAWAGPTRTPPVHGRNPHTTVAWLGRYDAWAAFDGATGDAWLVGDDPDACARLRARLAAGAAQAPAARVPVAPRPEPPELHLDAIRRALERIFAGDLYQVNLARRWTVPFEGHPLALMVAMRAESPVPLGLYVHDGERAVVSRTMETFLEWDAPGQPLCTRPIKGTIARHGGEDAGVATALRADPKEQAEHAMIVDLLRNDLGRIAQVGTVEVAGLMTVEPFAGLSHLVSTVRCLPRPDVDLAAIFEATFPPGSVTGAPKGRAVETIEALEHAPRGVYCGAVGHVSRTGGARFAVAIRTAVIEDGVATYHAGGGIVEASDPARELAETELKARVFLDALAHLRGDGRPTP